MGQLLHVINDFGTVKHNVNRHWVKYRKTLMNIYNGGSQFIWLSMTFGSVKYNVNPIYVYKQNRTGHHHYVHR